MSLGHVFIDLEGLTLTPIERELVCHPLVVGVVLFARNYESKQQLETLTRQLSALRSSLIIAVDQEGGRVQRFIEGFTRLPAMRHWGERYQQQPDLVVDEMAQVIQTLVSELQVVGVNVNLAPVLDLDLGVSNVIGERSFHSDPDIVATLGKVVIETMHAAGMPATGKHFPGHGGVTLDSHHKLPTDQRDWQLIWQQDLRPFRLLLDCLDAIMPAHIVYSAVDSLPVTYSRKWLMDILRSQLDYQGVIMSDDLTMAAAAVVGGYVERAEAALEAGCDLLLVCNNQAGAIQVLESLETYQNTQATNRIHCFTSQLAHL